jgi:hypothetical protein
MQGLGLRGYQTAPRISLGGAGDYTWTGVHTFDPGPLIAPLIWSGSGGGNAVGTYMGRIKFQRNAGTAAGNMIDVDFSNLSGVTSTPAAMRITTPASAASTAGIQAMQLGGTYLRPGGGVPFVLFAIAPIFEQQAVASTGQVFFFAPSVRDDGNVRTVGMGARVIIINPSFAALTVGSTGNPGNLTGMDMAPSVDASWNPVPLARFIGMGNPTGSHAVGITDLVGIDIPDVISKPTNVWSIRNVEVRARMHHRGSLNLGGGATPTQETVSLVALRDNAQEHTSITFDEETTDPAQPAADAEARVYFKNGKFVVQWNLAGTTIYTTFPVNSAGPYPVNPVITTDVVAP